MHYENSNKFLSRPHRHIIVFSFLASLSLPLVPLSSACHHHFLVSSLFLVLSLSSSHPLSSFCSLFPRPITSHVVVAPCPSSCPSCFLVRLSRFLIRSSRCSSACPVACLLILLLVHSSRCLFARPVACLLVLLLVRSSRCPSARPVARSLVRSSHSLIFSFARPSIPCSTRPSHPTILISPPLVSSLVSLLSSSPSHSSPHLVQSCMTSLPQRPLSFLPPQIVTHSHPFLVVLSHLISPVVLLLLFACLACLLPCPLSVVLFRPVPCCPVCSLYCHTMSIDCLAMNKE